MTWNHRVFKTKLPTGEDWFDIRETYYGTGPKGISWTVEPCAPGGETIDELREELNRMLRALEYPILENVDD